MHHPLISCGLLASVVVLALAISASAKNPYDNEDEYLRWDAWESPESFKEEFPYYQAGYDYEGRPVWIFDFWKWDLTAVIAAGGDNVQAFENYTEQMRFRLFNSPVYAPERIDAEGNLVVETWALLINMDKFNLKQLINYKAMKLAMKLWTYIEIATESMEYGFVVNTNFVAERFFNTLKPVLGKTLAKLTIRGTKKDKWLPEVLKFVPIEVLPETYGGHGKQNETFY